MIDSVINKNIDYIKSETLSESLSGENGHNFEFLKSDINGENFEVFLEKI